MFAGMLALLAAPWLPAGSAPGLSAVRPQESPEPSRAPLGFDVIYGDPEGKPRGWDYGPRGSRDITDPIVRTSPDGTWRFTQTPLQRQGYGPSDCRLERGNRAAWEARLPLTFSHAAVSEAGELVGCGVAEDFEVWLVSPTGEGRVVQRIRRTRASSLHTPDNPRIEGLVLHEDLGRFVVRVDSPDVLGPEQWLVYRLGDGTPLARLRPEVLAATRGALMFMQDARPLRGTPLTLVQWRRYDEGTRLALLDGAGREVWIHELPGDLDMPEFLHWLHVLRRQGTILRADQRGRFEVGFVQERQRVTFEATETEEEGAWQVCEVARAPYDPNPEAAAIVDVVPRVLGAVDLAVGGTEASPIRSIAAFEPTETGEIEFVRQGKEGGYELVLLDRAGRPRREAAVTGLPTALEGHLLWCRVAHERWILLLDTWDDAPARAWSIDAVSGEARPLEEFDCDEVAVTTSGLVVVCETISGKLHILDLDGKRQRTTSLAEACGAVELSASRVIRDAAGGVIVLGSSDQLWRTDLDGSPCTRFSVRTADGRTDRRLSYRLRVAPDGTLWTSDGNVLLRLDETGREVERLGPAASTDVLIEPAGAVVDELGRVCVPDAATDVVHVFGGDGRRLFACQPAPEDFAHLSHDFMTVDAEGKLHVRAFRKGAPRSLYLAFDPAGQRLGTTLHGEGRDLLPSRDAAPLDDRPCRAPEAARRGWTSRRGDRQAPGRALAALDPRLRSGARRLPRRAGQGGRRVEPRDLRSRRHPAAHLRPASRSVGA